MTGYAFDVLNCSINTMELTCSANSKLYSIATCRTNRYTLRISYPSLFSSDSAVTSGDPRSFYCIYPLSNAAR